MAPCNPGRGRVSDPPLLNSHDPSATEINLGMQQLLAEMPLDLIPEFQIWAATFMTVQHHKLFVTNNKKHII